MRKFLTFNHVLKNIFETRKIKDIKGLEREVTDMISEVEATVLYKMFIKASTQVSIEIGLAHGISALLFCQAHHEAQRIDTVTNIIRHYAIDPNQMTDYQSAAIRVLNEAGYAQIYKHLNGPSHLEIPKLIDKGLMVDCAFIDGWHTFDYTLIDFFLIDKILKPGGYVAFHDGYGRAKQKVMNFILTHRKYSIDSDLMNFKDGSFIQVLKFFIWRIYRDPMLLFSWFHWKYQLKRVSGLIILKKEESYEPNYDYFENF